MADLKTEPLGRFRICVSDEHTFGTDAVLLADFAGKKLSKNACDLGTGCGIIPLLLLKNGSAEKVSGVEIQSAAAEIAEHFGKTAAGGIILYGLLLGNIGSAVTAAQQSTRTAASAQKQSKYNQNQLAASTGTGNSPAGWASAARRR